ncbi:AraC family transcriptional regulator [Marinimicrobium agarilyticum]|uniref:AraC family transcriptional regulator n=1 Tax=Marinimicrobium agarilyticum TaxID=306546 RepID=UPI000405A196|nr:AraC family transcriptional regulator [Marinimicrobium agarilyticum]
MTEHRSLIEELGLDGASPDRKILVAREALAKNVLKWAPGNGIQTTAIPGLDVVRTDKPTMCMSSVYDPSLHLIVQGSKTIWLGDKELVYSSMHCLVSSVHLPVLGQVTQASPEQPYLGVRIGIEPKEVTSVILDMGEDAQFSDCPSGEANCGLCRSRAEPEMVEAIARLVALLDNPRDARILAPLIRREIIYRALMGEIGPRMRKFASVDSQAHRIAKVIALLKDRFTEPLRVRELADQANMSESALFHSFKQVTRMSPLQFQKRLRLHEARRLMVSEGMEAATASFRVGYESPSHFSREYSRMFGAPPRADVTKLRGEHPEAVRA